MSRAAAQSTGTHLVVDPVACAGVGLCSHLARDLVELDRWGYPLVQTDDLTRAEERQATRAVRGCPRQALAIVVR